MIKQLDKWHKTKTGLLVLGAAELLIAYLIASLAINNGNLWYYLLTLVLLVGSLQNFFKLIGRLFHHGKN
jgi:hypothetical protein